MVVGYSLGTLERDRHRRLFFDNQTVEQPGQPLATSQAES